MEQTMQGFLLIGFGKEQATFPFEAFASRLGLEGFSCVKVELVEEKWTKCSVPVILLTDICALGRRAKELGICVLAVEWEDGSGEPMREFPYVLLEPFELNAMAIMECYRAAIGMPRVIFETRNLLVREFAPDDESVLRRLNEEQEADFPRLFHFAKDMKETILGYRENQYSWFDYGLWAICRKEDGELIGYGGIEKLPQDREHCMNLGIVVKRDYWGKGIGTEFCIGASHYAKDKELCRTLLLRTKNNNRGMIEIAGKLSAALCKEENGRLTYEISLL